MNRNSARRLRRVATTLPLMLACGFAFAGCGGESSTAGPTAGSTAAASDCDDFPSKDISLVVPYSAGGGFDGWARLIAPYMETYLGDKVAIRVENIDGGGGMRAMNEISAAAPDGTKIVFTEPGFGAVNQILGRTSNGFDIRSLTYLGQATVDPQVFAVPADAGIDSITDLEGKTVKHAGQDISPIETITYDTFGIKGKFILHDATSETILALRRGDSDITVSSLSSMLEYLKPGDLKPLLFIGTEEITPDLLGYEILKDTETITDLGKPELGEVLEQYRVMAGPPELPACMTGILSEALSKTLADQDFVAKAEKANLRVIPAGAEETQKRVAATYETFEEYSDALERAIGGN